MSLADQMKAALGIDDDALRGQPSIYHHLDRGGGANNESRVRQIDQPQGGSESLRWASHKELKLSGEREETKRWVERQLDYCPYTNPVR